jgi:hypothetical protein
MKQPWPLVKANGFIFRWVIYSGVGIFHLSVRLLGPGAPRVRPQINLGGGLTYMSAARWVAVAWFCRNSLPPWLRSAPVPKGDRYIRKYLSFRGGFWPVCALPPVQSAPGERARARPVDALVIYSRGPLCSTDPRASFLLLTGVALRYSRY